MTLATDDDTGAPTESKGVALPITEDQVERLKELAQRVLREPFTRRPWMELAFFLVSGGLAVVGLAFIGVTMFLGVVLCITFFGLAFLGLSLRGARGMARWQRDLAHNLLGQAVEEPAPFTPRPGFFGWLQSVLRDRVAWRAVGYFAFKVPWTFLGVYVAFSLWWDAVACILRPLFWSSNGGSAVWGFFPNVITPGGNLSSGPVGFWHGVGIFILGVIFFFAAPWVMRCFVTVDKFLQRTLLGPDPIAARVRSLEQARTQTVDASAATLRRIERDLHDGTQAQLVALAMRLGMAKEKLEDPEHLDIERVRQLVDEAHRGAKEAIAELRDITAASTRPPSTSGWAARWRPSPRAARSRPRCTSTSPRAPPPPSRPSPTTASPSCWPTSRNTPTPHGPPCRVRSPAPGSVSSCATTGAAAPASRPSGRRRAAWPG